MGAHAAYREAEPRLVHFLFKFIMWVALVAATPFFALAWTFALFEKTVWWIVVPAAAGVLILVAGVGAWAWAWWWLRRAAETWRSVDRVFDA